MAQTITERLLHKIRIDPETGCWNFTGAKEPTGYGKLYVGGTKRLDKAHRIAYRLFIGPVDRKTILHHLCEHRICCNPLHLQPMTQGEHLRDYTPGTNAYIRSRQTHCTRGHALTIDNLVESERTRGHRRCKTCTHAKDRLRGSGTTRERRKLRPRPTSG